MGETCDRLQQQQLERLAGIAAATEASVSRNRWITVLLIALSLLVGAVVYWVVRQINSVLRQAATELREGAEQVSSAAA
jgi:methyl-accepting chemotaxis protein/methyl-accepting chemotaxis protein-1 (serine sensor receptor)